MSRITDFQHDVLDAIERTGHGPSRQRMNAPSRRAAIRTMERKGWFDTERTVGGYALKLTPTGKTLLAVERERRDRAARRAELHRMARTCQ